MQVQLLQGKVPWAAPELVHSGFFFGSVDWYFGAAQFCACGWPRSFCSDVLTPEETMCFAGCGESINDRVCFPMPAVDGLWLWRPWCQLASLFETGSSVGTVRCAVIVLLAAVFFSGIAIASVGKAPSGEGA